jgi:hypothetical protein
MEELLDEEITVVHELSLKKTIKMRGAPDVQKGIECFHLFMMDLLGVCIID